MHKLSGGHRMYRARCWLMLVSCCFYGGCENFNPAPVNFGIEDVVTVGEVQTLDIRGTIVSSLPVAAPTAVNEQVELGRLLFWDPILSGDLDTACATCHLPQHAYTDGLARSIGAGGSGRGAQRSSNGIASVERNAQSVVNSGWNGMNEVGIFDPSQAPMFWDNRNLSLKEQAIQPLLSAAEMRGENFSEDEILAEVVRRVNDNNEYVRLFSEAYGINSVSQLHIADALAAFQSTIVANQSAFDQWMRGDSSAMSPRQVSGLQEFVIAGCAKCHSGPLFSDFELHVLGVPEAEDLVLPDDGDGSFAFRTPSLRQLRFTAPYFHGGQFDTLAEVIEFYDEPEDSSNPHVPRSSLADDFLSLPEMDDGRGEIILEFLKALNDDQFDSVIPTTVPSGLTPGGN